MAKGCDSQHSHRCLRAPQCTYFLINPGHQGALLPTRADIHRSNSALSLRMDSIASPTSLPISSTSNCCLCCCRTCIKAVPMISPFAMRRQLPSTELNISMRNRISFLFSTVPRVKCSSGGKIMEKCARSPWIVHSATTRTLSRSILRTAIDPRGVFSQGSFGHSMAAACRALLAGCMDYTKGRSGAGRYSLIERGR